MWLVDFFRTHLVDNSNEIKEIGVWGDLCRAIVIRYSAMVVAVLLFTIFVMGAGASANPSEQLTIIMAPLFYIFSVFTAWLFFSKNRIGQAKWLMYALSFNKV
ncbi:hypothetical protein [Saccharospirillum alexandrii]|uniref:hypothetical protein n=1 Tax=Saccharospirillum alexandrii TaxID=2448477 RepID=UPI000FDB5436|nr:hypothetical protein [Saccharospirillum alexandrii]